MVLFSNVFIAGQDLLRMFGIGPDGGSLMLTRGPMKGSQGMPPMYNFFFIPLHGL